jgi:hypothetical protein
LGHVLELALDEERSPEHLERQRNSSPDAAHLDQRHVVFALSFIAGRLELESLTPDEYAEERRRLIKSERRRRQPRELYAGLLPTVGQIERIIGSDNGGGGSGAGPPAPDVGVAWDRALALAELEPREHLRDQRRHRGTHSDSLPLPAAIHYYVEANGELPSRDRFEQFRRLADVKVEHRPGKWAEHLEAAIAYRQTLGLSGSTEHPTIVGGRENEKPVRPPTQPIAGAGALTGKGRFKHTRQDCISAIEQFTQEGERPFTQARYRGFAQRYGLPAPRHFERYGGFRKLLQDVVHQ